MELPGIYVPLDIDANPARVAIVSVTRDVGSFKNVVEHTFKDLADSMKSTMHAAVGDIESAGSPTVHGTMSLDENPVKQAFAEASLDAASFTQNVTKDMVGVQNAMNNAATEGGNSFKNTLKGLKGDFGKGSALGQALKLAAGGGAIAALGLAANKFESLTSSINDLAIAEAKGELTDQQLYARLAGDVPILGSVAKGVVNLWDAISGQSAAIAKDAQYVKESDAAWENHLKIVDSNKLAARAAAVEFHKLHEELALALSPQSQEKNVLHSLSVGDEKQGVLDQFVQDSKLGPDGEFTKFRNDLKKATEARDSSLKRLRNFNATDQGLRSSNPLDKSLSFKAQIDLEKQLGDAQERLQLLKQSGDGFEKGESVAAITAGRNLFAIQVREAGQAGKEILGELSDNLASLLGTGNEWGEKAKHAEYDRQLDITNQAKQLTDSLRTPMEVFQDELAKAHSLLNAGKITPETFERLNNKGAVNLQHNDTISTNRIQAEDVFGSRTVTAQDTAQPLSEIAQTAKAQLAEQQATRRAIESQPAVTVTTFSMGS